MSWPVMRLGKCCVLGTHPWREEALIHKVLDFLDKKQQDQHHLHVIHMR